MKSVFDDAHGYLNSSIRAYVNATKTIDKLFAFKLVVLSMIVAVDRLIENMEFGTDTPFKTHIEDSSFFIPIAAYEQRMRDLMLLEEKNQLPTDLKLSQRLQKALDILKVVYEKYGLRPLLAVNIKEFINESQFFILDIQNLVESKVPNNNED
ncbi:MAG: hypothetical protein ACFE8U_14240 [Candidatus Hermodarchaeota archaeon]